MPRIHQIGGRNRGHPLLWLALLVAAFPGSLWQAWRWARDIPFLRENIGRGAAVWAMIWCVAWIAFAAVLVPAIIRVAQITRRMYRTPVSSAGHCPRCGYDLRESPDKCPECGRFVTASKTSEPIV